MISVWTSGSWHLGAAGYAKPQSAKRPPSGEQSRKAHSHSRADRPAAPSALSKLRLGCGVPHKWRGHRTRGDGGLHIRWRGHGDVFIASMRGLVDTFLPRLHGDVIILASSQVEARVGLASRNDGNSNPVVSFIERTCRRACRDGDGRRARAPTGGRSEAQVLGRSPAGA